MEPVTVQRPWGNFRQFTQNESTTVKIITVNPGESLSLQRHQNRSEFWHVLSGNPIITIGSSKSPAKAGDEFFVATEAAHRIASPDSTTTLLEISFGKFDEHDIERLEDNYGRA